MLARYTISHELGRSATGAVYAARDRTTGAVVALKRLDPASMDKSDPGFAERFLKHARSARKLKHRNIARILDAGEAAGTAYIAMEMLEGESLRKILDDGPLPIARAIRIAHDIASGLAHAHLQGMAHGALKPSSVMVLRSGEAKITDFGIAQAPGAAAGASYRSPEQLRGEAPSHRSDIFSLGALLYEMLAQRPPFAGDSPQQVLDSIQRGEPQRPSELNPHVPRAVDAIILRMLAAQPADRMPGVPIVRGELQRLMEGLGLESGADAGVDEPVATPVPPDRPEPKLRAVDPDGPRDTFGVGVRPGAPAPAAEESHDRIRIDREDFDYRKAMMQRESQRERSSGSRPAILAVLLLAVLGIGMGSFWYYSSGPSERRAAASRVQEAVAAPSKEPVAAFGPWQESRPRAAGERQAAQEPPRAAPAPEPLPQKSVVTERIPLAQKAEPVVPQASPPLTADDGQAKKEPPGTLLGLKPPPSNPLAAEPAPLPQAKTPVARAPEQPAPARPAPAKEVPQIKQPTAKVPAQQPGATARLILAVSPGGELYIDGKYLGDTPPTTTFNLEPGMYRVEVRSGSRKPYLTYMTLEPGDVRRITHDFNAKPSRPPT